MPKIEDNTTFLLNLQKEVNKKIETIKIFLNQTKNKLLKKEFILMLDNYKEISTELNDCIIRKNLSNPDPGMLGTLSNSASAKLKILFNKKSSHISNVLLNDNMKTIIEITKLLNNHKQLTEALKQYATELIRIIENSNEALKPFLK